MASTGWCEMRATLRFIAPFLALLLATAAGTAAAFPDKPVRIQDANTLITSDGLEFNNETRILKLLSNVRGRYEKTR